MTLKIWNGATAPLGMDGPCIAWAVTADRRVIDAVPFKTSEPGFIWCEGLGASLRFARDVVGVHVIITQVEFVEL
jgi:hypothetical protein